MTETPQAPNPTQVLADLIDAYASAKASGNETLQKIAVKPLQEFLNSHAIVPQSPESASLEEADGGEGEVD
jgi:hypothetical protein